MGSIVAALERVKIGQSVTSENLTMVPLLRRINVKTLFIEHGSPWENGYIENFNARLRDGLLDGEIFYTLKEAQIVMATRSAENQK